MLWSFKKAELACGICSDSVNVTEPSVTVGMSQTWRFSSSDFQVWHTNLKMASRDWKFIKNWLSFSKAHHLQNYTKVTAWASSFSFPECQAVTLAQPGLAWPTVWSWTVHAHHYSCWSGFILPTFAGKLLLLLLLFGGALWCYATNLVSPFTSVGFGRHHPLLNKSTTKEIPLCTITYSR